MKFQRGGFYRLLWNEYARSIPFTWHRTEKGAETIPKSYRYQGNVASDYYHQMCKGADGLARFAKETTMRIDWKEGRLIHEDNLTHHLCPPDASERAFAEVVGEIYGNVKRLPVKDTRWKCSVCGEHWPLRRRELP